MDAEDRGGASAARWFARAAVLAAQVTDPDARTEAYVDLLAVALELGDAEGARRVEAALAEAVPASRDGHRDYIRWYWGRTALTALPERARVLAEQIALAEYRALLGCDLGLMRLGVRPSASRVALRRAWERAAPPPASTDAIERGPILVERLETPRPRAELAAELAVAAARAGAREIAGAVIAREGEHRQAYREAPHARGVFLGRLALARALLGDEAGATRGFGRAIQQAHTSRFDAHNLGALRSIAGALCAVPELVGRPWRRVVARLHELAEGRYPGLRPDVAELTAQRDGPQAGLDALDAVGWSRSARGCDGVRCAAAVARIASGCGDTARAQRALDTALDGLEPNRADEGLEHLALVAAGRGLTLDRERAGVRRVVEHAATVPTGRYDLHLVHVVPAAVRVGAAHAAWLAFEAARVSWDATRGRSAVLPAIWAAAYAARAAAHGLLGA